MINYLICASSLMIIILVSFLIIKTIYNFIFYTFIIKKWGQIEAKILDAKYESYAPEGVPDNGGWEQNVLYAFTINGIIYKNTRITKNFGMSVPTQSAAKAISERTYKKGELVRVYFNKSNPKKSVLDNKFDYFNHTLVIIFIFLLNLFLQKLLDNINTDDSICQFIKSTFSVK
jgi:Protein of unknown function (DUF3592)